MKKIAKKICAFALDMLFPVTCLFCKKENEWICKGCFGQIKTNREHVCGVCEKAATPDGRTCHECKKKSSLAGLVVVSSYAESSIAQAVHLFKYRFIHGLHVPLGNLLVKTLKQTEIPLPDIIVPVPLHPRRLRWRGFNQAELLANHVSKNLLPNCEIALDSSLLVRKHYTPPQMGIKDFSSRQKNISGAFSAINSEAIKSKTILLVDDIATTGSTIFECAKVLKNAGAREVFAIVLARQEIGKK